MKKWLQKIFGTKKRSQYTVESGGVETSRASFRFDERDKKQRKNLLKKLNLYWKGKKDSPHTSYKSAPPASNVKRVVLPLLLLGAAVLFLQSGGFSLFSVLLEDIDYFRITEIRVQGTVNSTADEIRNASGVKVSDSLFSVDERRISELVQKESLWVEQVKVARQWPDTLILEVREFKPYALISVGDRERAQLYYLDKKGHTFIKTAYPMDLDFPVVTGLEESGSPETVPAELAAPLNLLRLAGSNNPNLPIQSISELHVDDQDGLILYLVEHPFPIFFGDGEVRKKYYR